MTASTEPEVQRGQNGATDVRRTSRFVLARNTCVPSHFEDA